MDAYMVILRIVHLFSGVFWVGSTFLLVGYIAPTVAAAGDAGRTFMSHFALKTGFSPAMAITGTLTTLSGLLMYWELFGFRTTTFNSGYGLAISIGALAGILALIFGFVFQFNSITKMKAINREVEASGGPPSPDQMAELGRHGERVALGSRIGIILMTIALLGMSTAQYLG
jgi:uncharacterized membrane protein